ncbi:hypothetical protein FGO68_gene3489 [Halteria grandinella]|uniref:Transmembrane protein n=1 Tax=Halteria grandinella TaxID=5974 RepID=A0A8J8P474_HALGN|nr:hypothetical protein FGO68_gene3489 [Halteria grandinella]
MSQHSGDNSSLYSTNGLLQGLSYFQSIDSNGENSPRHQNQPLKRLLTYGKDTIFQINYVLLHSHACSNAFYQLLMIFEFLQHIFFIFYGWTLKNGFTNLKQVTINVEKYVPKLLKQRAAEIANAAEESEKIREVLQSAQTIQIEDTTWRLDDYVKFSNPSLYLLELEGKTQYIYAFWTSIGIFYLFLLILIVSGRYIFKMQTGTVALPSYIQFIHKGLSLIMVILLTIVQVPFLTILFQIFKCEENPLVTYTIRDIKCDSQERQQMLPVAVITLGVYFVVSIAETIMIERVRFGSESPWAGKYRIPTILKMVVKIVLTCGFIFDKKALNKVQYMYSCCALLCIVLYNRFQGCNYYNKWVNIMQSFYDVYITYHLFFVGVHILASKRFQITSILIFIWTSSIFFGIYYFLFQCKRKKLTHSSRLLENLTSDDCEHMLQQLFDKFYRGDLHDQLLFQGCLSEHIETCDGSCDCRRIAENLQSVQKFEEFKAVLREKRLEANKAAGCDVFNYYYESMNSKASINRSARNLYGNTQKQEVKQIEKAISDSSQQQAMEDLSRDEHGQREDPLQKQRALEFDLQTFEEIFGHSLYQDFDHTQSFNSLEQGFQETSKVKEASLQFLAIIIQQVINHYPKKVCHRMHLACLYKYQLDKQFRAAFELIYCQNLENLSLSE